MSHQTKENVLFISGIDTNVGKTVATGMIAKALAKAGKKVITQKMIQTGCEHVSEVCRKPSSSCLQNNPCH